jgi:hypothetical protein
MNLVKNLTGAVVMLWGVTFLFACDSNDDIFLNDSVAVNERSDPGDETFVSSKQALETASIFFDTLLDSIATKSGVKEQKIIASIEAKKDSDNGTPLMYIINYEDGGFIIISATKNYYPVLAYSEKNSFVIHERMYGVLNWMEEMTEEIRESDTQDDKTLFKMHNMWKRYKKTEEDKTASDVKTKSSAEELTAFSRRVAELRNQYYDRGYRYYKLSDVLDKSLLPFAVSANLYAQAESLASPLEYTIVGIKNEDRFKTVGPLLTTNWHQGSPYNSLCPNSNRPAGCAAVAMAQIMNFYKQPQSLTYNGHTVNWNDMPNEAPYVVTVAHQVSNTHYFKLPLLIDVAFAWPHDIDDGFRAIGYSVSNKEHNDQDVGNELFIRQRPVMMLGFPGAVNPNGHYWVCDGADNSKHTIYYFAEYRLVSSGTNYEYDDIGGPSAENPALYEYGYAGYHCNWGWGNSYCDGWYASADSPKGNFNHYRENFYVHP